MIASGLFWTACLLAVAGGAVCVFARNLVHAAFALGASLLGVAALYLFLQAEYLAAIQVVVYVGGVLVLTVFGVMFSKDILGTGPKAPRWAWILGLPTAALVLAVMGRLAWATLHSGAVSAVRSAPGAYPQQTGALGDLLLGTYVSAFLLIAVLLTLVLVGAVVLVRKEQEGRS
jgi:NADH:ubiquinone oxidoreductase subunit 6 (subunit J)